ncbi:unnamed protein product [Oncorhynchus mykiss]|uniref:Uncharacterized protein n=2 Tax=Oncorhynchus mykiss TaxID=8022 RepID=A0A060YR50_ONCMY|nr:unnamed protein product [Oncorhynchus mykiss]
MVKRILGKPPNIFFKACWLVVSPLLIVAILVTAMVQHKPLLYEKTYLYPAWAEGVAWIIIFLSVGWIPLGAMHELLGRKGTCLARLKASVTPRITLEEVCNVPVNEDQHQDHVKSLYSLSEVSPLREEKDRGDM